MSVKFSNLAKKDCGVGMEDVCYPYFQKIKSNPGKEEHLVKLIKCLQANPNIDNDLLTLQSSIIFELMSIPGGYAYIDRYCEFLYANIYAPWVRESQPFINRYIDMYESLCSAMSEQLLEIKRTSIYKSLPDDEFLGGIKSLSVVFLILEYADQLSSYGYDQQASIVDKLNQMLIEDPTDGTFKKLAKKRDLVDKRGLPKIYQQPGIEYKLGCNCLCNSMFVLSFLRILVKNGRLGKFNDERAYENVDALASEQRGIGHNFIAINLDPLNVKFDIKKRFYIECTVGWSDANRTGKPLYKLEGNEFMKTVFGMIERFVRSSASTVMEFGDRMYPVDSTKIYTSVVRSHILSIIDSDKVNAWFKFWPKIFNGEVFDPFFILNDPNITSVQKIIVMLQYIKKFNKVSHLVPYYSSALKKTFNSPQLAQEIRNEVTYNGQLLLEFLQSWNLNERPDDYANLLTMIKEARKLNRW
jgi:hypothetical protein